MQLYSSKRTRTVGGFYTSTYIRVRQITQNPPFKGFFVHQWGIGTPSLNLRLVKVGSSKQGRLKLAQSILPLTFSQNQARAIANRQFKEGKRIPYSAAYQLLNRQGAEVFQ